ncbi:hypothetical protein BGZ83_004674 [Gryganskiella cystojenkinii]|nr:hypothetical protein BGZ83_004674 [Gryganskiella cystojenkinii]
MARKSKSNTRPSQVNKKPSTHKRSLVPPSATLVATAAMKKAIAECEAKVDEIVKECKQKNCKFRDSKFDLLYDRTRCLYRSLVKTDTNYFGIVSAKRVTELFRNPEFFINGAAPQDIEQGAIGDCWFLASLAVICNIPGLLEQLCVKRNEQIGVYGFIFFKDGDWVSTVVDDQLFYRTDSRNYKKSLYFSSCSEERETWLPLMEKAYAKIHGDYESLEGGFTAEGVEDLTGGIATAILTNDILDQDRFWNEEMVKVNKSVLLGCQCMEIDANERNGIQTGHAYSVIQVAEYKGERLVQIRNPWGRIEWNGAWSDRSENWTAEAIKELKLEDKDDGQFWMSYRDFLQCFSGIDRCRVFDSSWSVASTWIPYNVEPRSNGRFQIEVNKTSEVVVVLTQPDSRYFGAQTIEFEHDLSFHVYKTETMELIQRARPTLEHRKRSVNCELTLEPGHYTVVPHVIREAVSLKVQNQVEIDAEDGDEDEEDEDEGGDNAVGPSLETDGLVVKLDTVKIDSNTFMFEQRKAKLVRAMSIARIKGRTMLGVDDDDYLSDSDLDVEEEDKWQIMLGLRVYSHDSGLALTSEVGTLPTIKSKAKAKKGDDDTEEGDKVIEDAEAEAEEHDPEGVTPASAEKDANEKDDEKEE